MEDTRQDTNKATLEIQRIRQFFITNGMEDNTEVDELIAKLDIKTYEDIAAFTDKNEFADAGVTSPRLRNKLAKAALKLEESIETNKKSFTEEIDKPSTELTSGSLSIEDVLDDIDLGNDNWLKTIGLDSLLNFGPKTYLVGLKAFLAARLGLFSSVENLRKMMLDYALQNGISVTNLYYVLYKILINREYGMAAVSQETSDGIPICATAKEMNELMYRVQEYFIPAIRKAITVVEEWYKLYAETNKDEFFASYGVSGHKRIPNPAAIYEMGKELRDSINRTFAGTGTQTAMAICREYSDLVAVLDDKSLPATVGAINKDAVLSSLGFNVDSAVIRSEQHLICFVLGIIDIERLARNDERGFLCRLYDTACQIDKSVLKDIPKHTSIPNDSTAISNVERRGCGESSTTKLEADNNRATLPNNHNNTSRTENPSPALVQMNGQPVDS